MMTANDIKIIADVLRLLPVHVREVVAPRFEQSLEAHCPNAFNLAKWRRAMATADDPSQPRSALEERLLNLPDNAALKTWSKEKPRR
jgi:hypothetical protein